jgi:hypothetical protein
MHHRDTVEHQGGHVLYCQSEPMAHRSPAAYALTFARSCGHRSPAQVLTRCEHCGRFSPLMLIQIEDVFEKRVIIPFPRAKVESSAFSPITLAYDRAYAAAQDRGLAPVIAYRMPVRWLDAGPRSTGEEMMEAHVTLAVTLPDPAEHPADQLTG